MKGRTTTGWISQMFGKEIQLTPRRSPDEIPAARQFWDLRHLNQDLPDLAAFHERVVVRSRGGTDLTAEIYVPNGEGPFPLMLYMHGGSWCLWSPAHVRKMVMRFAAVAGYVVVNLDYGLAPEHPFPWAVEDTVYASRWTVRNAHRFGAREDCLVLGGDSAGANLAAAAIVALAGDGGKVLEKDDLAGTDARVAGALLLYGIFDFPLLFLEPGKNADAGTIETTWNLAYLGPNFVSVHRNPLVSPAYWPRIAEFPPVYLSCGARDALLPQTLRMLDALTKADVPTTASIVGDADHGFLMMADRNADAMNESVRICDWLRNLSAQRETVPARLCSQGNNEQTNGQIQQVTKCVLL